jgi:fatty acid amide hydrolase
MMEDCKHNVLDGKAVPMAWNQTIFESKRPLRIGYHTSLSIFPSMGDTADTVLAAKRAFESVGHTLIPFEIPDSEKYQHLTMRLWNADMGKHLVQNLKNEEVGVVVKHLHAFSSLPRWQKKFYSWLPAWLSPYNPNLLNTAFSAEYSSELWDLMSERRAVIQELLDRMKALKLDLLLGPAWPFPALKVDDIVQAAGDAGMYSFIWNFMDFPAGIVKVGKESGRHFGDDYPENGMFYRKLARKSIRESVGMPIGVQIIGPPFHEELVLRAMVELEKQIEN